MKHLLAWLALAAACTTERNPDVCCTTDADCALLGIPPAGCADGFVCTHFTCVAAACSADANCTAAAPVCDLTTATCGACTASSDCAAYAASPVCDTASGACRACRLDAECASDVCDVDTGRCAAEADVLYASATGADTATCTRASPCSTSRAIIVAGADPSLSIVRLLPGTYGTAIVVSSGTTSIYGSGAKLAPPVGAAPYALEARDTAALEVRGLEIDRGSAGANATLAKGAGSLFPSLTLRESEIHGLLNVEHGKVKLRQTTVLGTDLAFILSDSDFEADRSRFETLSSGFLRSLGQRMSVRITNSILEGATITMSNSDTAPAKSEYYVAFSTFVLDASATAQDCTNTSNASRVAVFENNILFSSKPGNVILGTACTVSGNITHPQVPGLGGSNVDVDPRFVDAPARDYRLQTGSPAVDAAGPSSGANGDHDFAGTPRPQGPKKDIGAFERAL